MEIVKWRDSYSTGVKKMDEQHEQLIGMINQLYSMIRGNSTQVEINEIIDSCIDYAKNHLDDEENLLKKHKYPDLADQLSSHELFTDTITQMRERQKDEPEEVTQEIYTYLRKWWIDHIVGEDKLYGPFLNEKGVS